MTRVVLLTARTNAFSLLMQVITLVRASLPFGSSSAARLTLSPSPSSRSSLADCLSPYSGS